MDQIDFQIEQIRKDANEITKGLLNRLSVAKENLQRAVDNVTDSVSSLAKSIEVCSNAESRFATLCAGLEHLEQSKRGLDVCFSSFLGSDTMIAEAKMRLIGWEGDMTFYEMRSHDAAETVSKLQEFQQRVEAAEGQFIKDRLWAERIVCRLLPHFLEEVYRASDAERSGLGFRTKSVLTLCGAFCNEIKFS